MSLLSMCNVDNQYYQPSGTTFRANNTPAENKAPLEKLADKIDEEKKKKQNKTAIAVGGSVLGLSLLVAVSNPRVSTKLIQSLKNMQTKMNQKLRKSKGDLVKTKFYKAVSNFVDWSSRFLSWTNNVNSVKDTYYKQLCTEEKTFFNVNNLERRKRLGKFDKFFRKIMQKPHELITKWGDSLAKGTVRNSYKKASKKMDALENLIQIYSEKLSENERKEITEQLLNIKTKREYFSEESINGRLTKQGELMKDLNSKIRRKWYEYKHGFKNKHVNNTTHFNQNLSFWAQDIMEPERNYLGQEGQKAIDSFISKSGGEYNKLIEKLSQNLTAEEKASLEKSLKKVEKSLNKANNNEVGNYFDKKRDLMLGSAPTDILSGTIGLAIGGVSLAAADDKDKRISRLITSILPAIAGFGTNIALTTMLFSGTKGMLYGVGAGGILSLIGSRIDKARLAAKNKTPYDEP